MQLRTDPSHRQIDVGTDYWDPDEWHISRELPNGPTDMLNAQPAGWISKDSLNGWISASSNYTPGETNLDIHAVGDVIRFEFRNGSWTYVIKDVCEDKFIYSDSKTSFGYYLAMPD